MPAERYFLERRYFPEQTLALEEEGELHHLARVMRAQEGDEVELVNGQGELAQAVIERVEKKRVWLRILSFVSVPSPFPLIIAQALPRLNRLDFILEKGTELGMSSLWLFPGSLSERKSLTLHQMQRMKAVTIAAMKQCGRLHLPPIEVFPPLLQQGEIPPYALFFGDVSPEAPPLQSVWNENFPQQGAVFFIGPESGFTSQEIERLKQMGAKGVKLHTHILRTDTASLAALSLMSHWLLA